MHLPIDDAEHQLQVFPDARSPAALQLVGYASDSARLTRAAWSLMGLVVCCARKIASQSARATRTPSRIASGSSPESRENAGQEGFDALREAVSGGHTASSCRAALTSRRV